MLEIEEKEIIINGQLKRKIEIMCRFCNTKPIFFNGSIRNIKGTNIAYLKPHSVVINKITYLLFDNFDYVFIGNLTNKTPINELENYIKNTIKKM